MPGQDHQRRKSLRDLIFTLSQKLDRAHSDRDGRQIFTCPIGNSYAHIDPEDGISCECGDGTHTEADVEWSLRYLARVMPQKCPERVNEYSSHLKTCQLHQRWMEALRQATRVITEQFSKVGEEEDEAVALVVDVPELGTQVKVGMGEMMDRVKTEALREKSRDILARNQQRPYAEQWYGRTGAEFDPNKPEPKPHRLKFSRFPERFMLTPGFHILFGPSGVLKTWLCAEALLQEVREGRVGFFIDYEDIYDEFFRKMHTLGASPAEMARVAYVRPPGPLTDDGREHLIRRFEDDFGQVPSVGVIDSIGQGVAAYGLDDNAGGGNGVGRFIEDIVMWLKNQYPTMTQIGIDHLPKGVDPNLALTPLGSARKGFAADGTWSMPALGEKPTRDRKGQFRCTSRKDRRGWFADNEPVFDATFGGGEELILSEADPNVLGVDFTGVGGPNDFTADELPVVVLIAKLVLANPGVTVESARVRLGLNNKVFGDLKNKMVANDVLVHQIRKGLTPGPGMRAFFIFAHLFGFDSDRD
jgi:hypothetical protein